MSQKYNDYLKTDYWKAAAEAAKKRDGYRCRICNSQHDLSAHHRCYDHRGRELDFLEDLTTLCRRCHGVFHGVVSMPEPPMPAKAPDPLRNLSKKERRALRVKESGGMTNVRPHTEAGIDADLPQQDPIYLTRDLLDLCRANGAFTGATIVSLGVSGRTQHGWVDRLCGTLVSRSQFRQALAGRYIYSKPCFPKASNSPSRQGG